MVRHHSAAEIHKADSEIVYKVFKSRLFSDLSYFFSIIVTAFGSIPGCKKKNLFKISFANFFLT